MSRSGLTFTSLNHEGYEGHEETVIRLTASDPFHDRSIGRFAFLRILRVLRGSIALVFSISAQAEGPQPPRSGVEFQSADVRAMQADDFANPATLWL